MTVSGSTLHEHESPHSSPDVLLVEDGPAELYLLKYAFATGPLSIHLHIATSVEEALAFLRHEGSHPHAPRLHLVVTSIRLPDMSGLDLLAELKGDPNLRAIPVVVFSLYEAPELIAQSYALGANGYVIKPSEFDAFVAAVHTIETYWLTVAELSSPLRP